MSKAFLRVDPPVPHSDNAFGALRHFLTVRYQNDGHALVAVQVSE